MSHLAWPHLLTVAAWQRTMRAVLDTGHALEVYSDDPPAKVIWDQFQVDLPAQRLDLGRAVRAHAEAIQEGPAVDAYFGRLSTALAPLGNYATKSSHASTLFGALRGVITSQPCATCSARRALSQGGPAHVCLWTATSQAIDQATLLDEGTCIDSINELFQWAVDLSMESYRNATGLAPAQKLEFSTALGSRNQALGISVDGFTRERNPTKLRSIVTVLDVNTLGFDDFLSLPYLLVHECLVHGFCGLNVEEKAAVSSRSFHDGWMDCVAAYVLQHASVNGLGLSRYIQLFTRQM